MLGGKIQANIVLCVHSVMHTKLDNWLTYFVYLFVCLCANRMDMWVVAYHNFPPVPPQVAPRHLGSYRRARRTHRLGRSTGARRCWFAAVPGSGFPFSAAARKIAPT